MFLGYGVFTTAAKAGFLIPVSVLGAKGACMKTVTFPQIIGLHEKTNTAFEEIKWFCVQV